MKALKLIGLLTIILNIMACGQTTENNAQIEVPKGWKSLQENNYSINYPDNWELNTSGEFGTSFILFSPLTSDQDKFKENINLLIQDLTGYNLDLDKYVELSESQVKTMITEGEILESKRIITENLNYQKVIYTGKQGVFDLKFEQYYWVVGNKAYVLTLTCEEDQFDDYQEIGEKMLNEFRVDLN